MPFKKLFKRARKRVKKLIPKEINPNHYLPFDVPGLGIKCESGLYVDLTNCDFCTIIGTFS